MKARTIIIAFLLLAAFSSYAQGPKKEKLKALKVAFFTTELSLTAAEAEKFWPVYNAYEDKQFENRFRKMSRIKSRLENIGSLDEKEAQSLLAQFETAEEDLHQNKKKLIEDLKTFLPAAKILRLKKAEDDFNRKLLKQYRGSRTAKP